VSDEPNQASAEPNRVDRLLEEFHAALEDSSVLGLPEHEMPRRLHHYTTTEGLLGIVEKSTIWASDVRYMNDSSELSYASHLIEEVVAEAISEVEDEPLKAALPQRYGDEPLKLVPPQRYDLANGFEHGGLRPFVACFCENGDLLSQWRGYAAGTTGFSLGIDVGGLARRQELPPNTYLRKVIYDEERQRAMVRDIVGTWLRTAQSLLDADQTLGPTDLFPYPAIWALERALTEHHLCFKHPTFAEEHEWRLIKLVNVREELDLRDHHRREAWDREMGYPPSKRPPPRETPWVGVHAEGIDIKFRATPLGLVPYVELSLLARAGLFGGRLPLPEVTQGPVPDPELALSSLTMYLESQGLTWPHTTISASGIPLRR
jgi:hypothetical protein